MTEKEKLIAELVEKKETYYKEMEEIWKELGNLEFKYDIVQFEAERSRDFTELDKLQAERNRLEDLEYLKKTKHKEEIKILFEKISELE